MKKWAYYYIEDCKGDGSVYEIVLCERDVKGYRPVPEYGPYADEKHTKELVKRLNDRIGVSPRVAHRIIASTMPIGAPA